PFAFYGHTHVAKYENIAGIHVINPGSISQSRSNIEETFAELIINDTDTQAQLNFRNRENKIIDTVKIDI
ncbi:metallophosphoesterase family protein, partial [Streptococcus pyogenes]